MSERATVKVLMSPELMAEWATRDTSGNLLRWDWSQNDGDGFRTPVVSVDYADNLVDAYIARLRAAVEGLPDDCHDREGLRCQRDKQGRCTPVARADVLAAIDAARDGEP